MIRLPSHLGEVIQAGGAVVVPSRQRAHAVRLAHAAAQLERGLTVWTSADVLPLSGWLTREIERCAAGPESGGLPRLLSAAEEWLLWRECTAEAADTLELVNRAALASDLRRAARLAAQLRLDLHALRAPPGTETALLLTVHRAVEARCRALGAASLPACLARLPVLGDERTVAFGGFQSAPPELRSLTEARLDRGWHTLLPAAPPPAQGEPRVVMPADEPEELDRIADWCRRCLWAQPQGRLLVVLPGPAGRRERLATLIRQALEPRTALSVRPQEQDAQVAIEGGEALPARPAVAHALTSLGLLCGETLALERLTEWLLSPFWSEPLAARARLTLWLRERAGVTLDRQALLIALTGAPAPLEATARSVASRVEQAAAVLRDPSGSPRHWSERFHGALEALGWPGNRTLGSAEQQTLVRFRELLDEFGQLSGALGVLERGAAFQRLHELAAQTAYRPADEDAAVTLTAALADPVVRYDGLWVAGLHAEAFPQPAAPDPFVPLAAQLKAGWPAASASGRLAEARSLLGAWRAAAAELVLSAPRRSEDLDLLPSPLLSAWRSSQQPDAPGTIAWLPVRVRRPDLTEPWEDAGLPFPEGQPLPSGTRSLELQNQCPFRAYAELRLGACELASSEPGVAADFRGQLLHAACQRLWDTLRDSRALGALPPPELIELIGRSVEGAVRELSAEAGVLPSQQALARERRRTERLILQLCDLERKRPAFSVRHTEHKSHVEVGGLQLRVRIDRIDALESGGLAILDYKSGRPVSGDWYGERPSHPQLLTYLTAVGDDVLALATVNITAREIRFQGIAAQEGLLPKVGAAKAPPGAQEAWPARVREWRERVEHLARDFAAGQARLDPKPGACDYCHLGSVCRIGDADSDSGDTGDEAPGG